MSSTKPSDPAVILRINSCISDLKNLLVDLKKSKALSQELGKVKDNITSLELLRDYGSYGGKVPWPVSEPSLSLFKSNEISDLIHEPWKPKSRE